MKIFFFRFVCELAERMYQFLQRPRIIKNWLLITGNGFSHFSTNELQILLQISAKKLSYLITGCVDAAYNMLNSTRIRHGTN